MAPGSGGETIRCPQCDAGHVPIGNVNNSRNNVYAATCQGCGYFFKFRTDPTPKTSVTFTINGISHTVGNEFPPDMSLNEYIRDIAKLTGTKVMCAEGGCGACVVTVAHNNKSCAINSCLCPIYSCDGWSILTTEGIGSKKSGFHPIQEKLADFNGSQCGFCSPGMVMNMYGLLSANAKPTMQEVEDAFDGNICRCTGFRPILDAMKSFSIDTDVCERSVEDIEDINKRLCSKTGKPCTGTCSDAHNNSPARLHLVLEGAQWFTPGSLDELYALVDQFQGKKIKFVAGNTGKGVFRDGPYDIFIDTKHCNDLSQYSNDPPDVFFGANVTLSQLITLLTPLGNKVGYEYCGVLAQHIKRIANTPVRNVATWAGNLMLKHAHNNFPSDIFVILETVGAQLTIKTKTGISECSPLSFLSFCTPEDMIILRMKLPANTTNSFINTYKIMPRSQNAHAYVNAGFNMQIDKDNNYQVAGTPSIVYGGINSSFVHAASTESYLAGKHLGDVAVLQGALRTLQNEIVPDSSPVLSSPLYRKNLAMALFYKFVLMVCKDKASASYQSGGTNIQRPLSSGKQTYDTDQSEYPVSQPIPKITGRIQASGEAGYAPDLTSDLHGEFLLSTIGSGKILNIDASEALKMPGVVAFYSAQDIPGTNNFMVGQDAEEIFSSGTVLYNGQALGLIVAESRRGAVAAVDAVKVTYTDIQTPILTITDAIAKQSLFPDHHHEVKMGNAEAAISAAPKSIEGQINMETQYHLYMETQTCVTHPTEYGLDVHASTQQCTTIQQGIAQVLGVKDNSVRVIVSRLGGGYGGKISRNGMVSTACALAAYKLNRSVKVHLGLHTNMKMVGKRCPYLAKYKAGFDGSGRLEGIVIQYYNDGGCSPNDDGQAFVWGDNAYYCANWHFLYDVVKTNTPSTTATRAPGSTPAIFIMETVMEHVAKSLNLNPTQIRTANLYQNGQKTPTGSVLSNCIVRPLVDEAIKDADFNSRAADIATFNRQNRWKKRGISIVPMKFGLNDFFMFQGIQINVYGGDGTITVSHGGIEMGQGINTKVMQVVAYKLAVPVDIINVSPTDTRGAGANGQVSGGSVTSESVCHGFINACKILNDRMAPVKAKIKDPTWLKVVQACYAQGISLVVQYWENPPDNPYNAYGATVAEAEMDVLTGEYIVHRMDILYDCGISLNPTIDIGQIEGAVTMGLGYWLLEKIRYDPQTGENLTSGTWEYKPPTSKDIPVDLRVNLLKSDRFPPGVLGSKAVAEPPLCMSCSVLFAIKRCIEAALEDQQSPPGYFPLDAPATVEVVQTKCRPNISLYTYGN